MKLTNACLAEVNNLLNNKRFSNPECKYRAFSAIRRVINQTYAVAKAESVKWMFRIMNTKGLVLRTVQTMCAKLYNG